MAMRFLVFFIEKAQYKVLILSLLFLLLNTVSIHKWQHFSFKHVLITE